MSTTEQINKSHLVYMYIYTEYPLPAGIVWHRGAGCRILMPPYPVRQKVLKQWGLQAAKWSRQTLTQLLEEAGHTFDRTKWTVGQLSYRSSVPSGTPNFTPKVNDLVAAAPEVGVEDVVFVDGELEYDDKEVEDLRNA